MRGGKGRVHCGKLKGKIFFFFINASKVAVKQALHNHFLRRLEHEHGGEKANA